MLNGSGDIFGSYDVSKVLPRIDKIYDTTLTILERSLAEDRPPHFIADELARQKIAKG